MIKSMTGFGKSNLARETRNYEMEIRCVNHRYLDITVKMPRSISFLEEYIKKEITKVIKRGKIDVYINFEDTSDSTKNITINKEIAKLYIGELKKISNEENLNSTINLVEILKLPDILNVSNLYNDETIKCEILELTNNILSQIVDMKKVEGQKISNDLTQRLNIIKKEVFKISEISTLLISQYSVKLENRIKEILKNDIIDNVRLAQEVVIYADKSSIEEEITRLYSHIEQFISTTEKNNEDPKGKKLDFILQEMFREINTIASKGNDIKITNMVVEIKNEIENIREQVQNVE